MMANYNQIDVCGETFGRLYALRDVGSCRTGRLWYCLCSCGGKKVVPTSQLNSGSTKSCGCLVFDHARQMGIEWGRINLGRAYKRGEIGLHGLDLDEALA